MIMASVPRMAFYSLENNRLGSDLCEIKKTLSKGVRKTAMSYALHASLNPDLKTEMREYSIPIHPGKDEQGDRRK